MAKQPIPDRFLINRIDIQEICEAYIKKRQTASLLMNFAFAGFGAAISYGLSEPDWLNKGLFWIIVVISLFLLIISLWMQKPRNHARDLLEDISTTALKKSDYTGIFLVSKIAKPEKEGLPDQLFLMTELHEPSNEVFLLYIKNLEQYEENGELDINRIQEAFARKIGVNTLATRIEIVHNYNEIKRTSSTSEEKMIRYVFFRVRISENVQTIVEMKYPWKSMKELLTDPKALGYNLEVLSQVNNHLAGSLGNTFCKMDEFDPIKIIWNITNKCKYNCNICATHSSRVELTADEKHTALINILSIGNDRIRQIDFSGGDPLEKQECIDLIIKTQAIISKDKVSVTTTGEGVANVKRNHVEMLHDLLANCEITVDEIQEIPDYIRQEGNYFSKNLFSITQNADIIGHLTVNVPILRPDMGKEAIFSLVDKIAELKVADKSCTLIRLMRTGRMVNNYDDTYDPEKFIASFIERTSEYGLHVNIQCALEGDYYQIDNCCTMLQEKIGIDCAGNVFACAWGGYVCEELEENPFFIGNVYHDKLSTILNSEKALSLREKIKSDSHGCCRVFNYFAGDSKDIFCDKDPLIKMRDEHD